MAPQPLSRVNPKATTTFGPQCFDSHPELSRLVAHAINTGSMIEARWSVILVNLVKADPRTGAAMYQALSSSEARRAALSAAASIRLSKDDNLLFQAVTKVTTPQRNARNQFAHHIWGMSPQLEDTLLLADPTFFTDIVVDATTRIEKIGHLKLLPAFPKLDYSKIDVWTRKSLEKANKLADEAQEIILDLTKGISRYEAKGIDEQWRKKLIDRSSISQALDRLSKKGP